MERCVDSGTDEELDVEANAHVHVQLFGFPKTQGIVGHSEVEQQQRTSVDMLEPIAFICRVRLFLAAIVHLEFEQRTEKRAARPEDSRLVLGALEEPFVDLTTAIELLKQHQSLS